MPHSLSAALLISALLGHAQESFRITGVVHDRQGGALPGVEVIVDGRTVVTDEEGRFELPNLVPGTYEMTARLPGFRTQIRQVRVGASRTIVTIVLPLGTLAEVLHVVPEPRDAFRQADAIAHVRLVRQLPPPPCEELSVISAVHEGAVLAVLKGTLPATVQLLQDSSGTCLEGSMVRHGIGSAPYAIGSEYIFFLVRVGSRYDRVGGGGLAFSVQPGGVVTRGFQGLPAVVSVERFRQALQELSR